MGRLALSTGKGTPSADASVVLAGFGATSSSGAMAAVIAANSVALTGLLATASKGALSAGGDIPASVNAPSAGTDLSAVWALQDSGTGPRSSPTNGTWAGSLDAYLTGKGFIIGNDNGALWLNVGTSTVTVSNYDFTSTPRIQITGSGAGQAIFVDCTFDDNDAFAAVNGGMSAPTDINGTINITSSTLTVEYQYCLVNLTPTYMGTGTMNFKHCRFSNHVQMIWGSSNATILIEDCYNTGGGCNPPAASHVELIQFNATSPRSFTARRTLINFIDGQASLGVPAGGNYGWTGVFTGPGGGPMTLEDCIIIGLTEIDSNPSNPARMGCTVQYNDTTAVTITNCVLEQATFGYSLNGTPGGTNRPTVSGNRTFANVALTTPDFG